MSIAYVARRLLLLVPMIFGIAAAAFVVSHLVPGDPAAVNLGQYAMSDPKIVAAYRHEWGFDKPLPVQFAIYIGHLAQGDLGVSQQTHRPVLVDIGDYLPATAELACAAMTLSLLIGIPLGVVSASCRDKFADQFVRILSLIGLSIPVFWLGLVALDVLYVHFSLLPGPGRLDESLQPPAHITGFYTIDALREGNWADLRSASAHLVLPALVLSAFTTGQLARITRATLLETLGNHYIRTARSKGLGRWRVIVRHALPNALVPVVTSVGSTFGHLLSGAVLTETVFNWPGIGRYSYQASTTLDFSAIVGVACVIAVMFALVNLAADIVCAIIDPRTQT